MVNSMTKTHQASMYNDQRSSLPFSPMTGEILDNSRQTTAPMSYDQASAFEEWPELHQKLMKIQERRSSQPRQPNLSVEILNSLILQS